jgi:hypothetical protein
MLKYIGILGIIFLVASCSGGEKTSMETSTIVVASGPLYDGVNTATGTLEMDGFLPENIQKNQIQNATVLSVTLDSQGKEIPNIQSLTLLITSSTIPMQKIAFAENIEWKEGKLELKIAAEQEKLNEIIQDKSATIVIDFDLMEEWEENLELKCTINWEITVK